MLKKKRIIVLLTIVFFIGIVFSNRDVVLYYVSGLEYVRQNYDVTVTEIPSDIKIDVDLTVVLGQNTDGALHTAYSLNDCVMQYSDIGSSRYLFDNHYNIKSDVGVVEGNNYKLQFIDNSFGANPFAFSTLLPLDQHKYYESLTTQKTVTGDEAMLDIPVDNITVTVGDMIYKPVWYALYPHWTNNQLIFRLGLFADPSVYDTLIDRGYTTATIHISKLYYTEYKLPSILRVFEPRIVPSYETDVKESKPVFESTTSGYYLDRENGIYYSVETATDFERDQEYLFARHRGIITANIDFSHAIVAAEPIVTSEIPFEWEVWLQDRVIDGAHFGTNKLPYSWDSAGGSHELHWVVESRNYDYVLSPNQDVKKLVDVQGIRLYFDNGDIYEFYDKNQFVKIK